MMFVRGKSNLYIMSCSRLSTTVNAKRVRFPPASPQKKENERKRREMFDDALAKFKQNDPQVRCLLSAC
jgi:hypothetical protein